MTFFLKNGSEIWDLELGIRKLELDSSLFVYSYIRYSETMIYAISGLSVPQYDSACD